jgi:hypothetical protein
MNRVYDAQERHVNGDGLTDKGTEICEITADGTRKVTMHKLNQANSLFLRSTPFERPAQLRRRLYQARVSEVVDDIWEAEIQQPNL